MWEIAVYIAVIFLLATILCYLQRFWYFRDIKGVTGGFPLPILMNALSFRNPEKLIDLLLYIAKDINQIGYKASIGLDQYIVLLDSDAISSVLNSQEILMKSNDYRLFRPLFGDGLLLSTGEKWTKRRKLLNPTFHSSILRDFVTTFEANTHDLIEVLKQRSNGSPIEVYDVLSLYTLNMICETSLGVSFDAQRNKKHKYVLVTEQLKKLSIKRIISPWKRLDFLYKFTWEYKISLSLCDWIHKYIYAIIDERRQTLTDFDDDFIDQNGVRKKLVFLDMLIKSTVDGMPLSNEDINEEANTFMAAGSDTITTALTFILYCLSQHPEIQERLFKEQEEVLGEAVEATVDDFKKMEYLEMVIKEVMRVYPPAPMFIRNAQSNVSMAFGTLKKDIQVVISPMVLHRKPEYFPDPDRFDPERFSPENIKNIKPYTYLPFSGGYRNCIGQKYAMLAMKSAISRIVKNFKIHPDLTFKPILVFDIVLTSKNGIRVILENRH